MGIAVVFVLLQHMGKLPVRIRRLKTALSLGARTAAISLRNIGSIPSGSVPPWELSAKSSLLTSFDLKANLVKDKIDEEGEWHWRKSGAEAVKGILPPLLGSKFRKNRY